MNTVEGANGMDVPAKAQPRKQWRAWLVGAAVSLGGAYLLLAQVDRQQLSHALATARFGYLLPCAGLLFLGLFVRAQRWRTLLDGALSASQSFSIVSIAYLTNSLLPLRAGEVVRVLLASRHEPPVPILQSASTILVERLLDLLVIVVWMALAISQGTPLPPEIRAAALMAAPTVLVGFAALLILARQRTVADRLLMALTQRIPLLARLQLDKRARPILDGLQPLAQPRKLVTVLAITLAGWLCTTGAGWALMYAFFPQGDWVTASLFIGAVAFAVALPAVPGNLGTFELAIVAVLELTGYGEPAGKALIFAVTLHTVDLLVYLVAGVVGLMRQGISPGQLSQQVRSAASQL